MENERDTRYVPTTVEHLVAQGIERERAEALIALFEQVDIQFGSFTLASGLATSFQLVMQMQNLSTSSN